MEKNQFFEGDWFFKGNCRKPGTRQSWNTWPNAFLSASLWNFLLFFFCDASCFLFWFQIRCFLLFWFFLWSTFFHRLLLLFLLLSRFCLIVLWGDEEEESAVGSRRLKETLATRDGRKWIWIFFLSACFVVFFFFCFFFYGDVCFFFLVATVIFWFL